MPNTAKNPAPPKKTLKRFHIGTGQPISVRFTNPAANLTRIRVGGQDLTQNTIEFPRLRGQDAMHKLDFEVEFHKGKDENFLHHSRKLDIEIQSGDRVYRDTVWPDIGGRRIAYRFLNEEFGPKLFYCAKCDDYVQPDANGRCRIHH
jgi:thioredoxin reductase